MPAVKQYPQELRERAVRMYHETRPNYPTDWSAMTAIAEHLGVGSPETIRNWVRRNEIGTGARPGVTTHETKENAELRREVAELRRANEILKAATTFFAKEADPHRKR